MKFINYSVFITVLTFFSQVNAQQSQIYTHDQKEYQEALELYNNKQYQAAQSIFKEVKENTNDNEIKANSDYYIANAAIRLNQGNADRLMEDFVKNHSTSTKRNAVTLDVGNYYGEQGEYVDAADWYTQTED